MALPSRKQILRRAVNALTGDADAPETEIWAPDDLAECMVSREWISMKGERASVPARGDVYVVIDVRICDKFDGTRRQYLIFQRWPRRMFDARAFRRLIPRADAADAADAAFLDQLKQIPAPLAARLERTLP